MPISNNVKQKTATDYIPYTNPYDEFTCGTVDGDLTRTIQLAGVPFETMANEDINGLTRQWFSSINGIGAKNTKVALWTHLIRRKIHYDLSGIKYDNYFSTELNKQYAKRLEGKDFFTNEIFISPVYRPAPGDAERFAKKFSKNENQQKLMRDAGLAELEKITQQMMTSLRRYHPKMLSTDVQPDGSITSETSRFYSRLLNGGESGPVALNNYSVRYAIQRNDLHFGNEIVEIQGPASSRFVAILGIKAPYGIEKIDASILHGLLRLPCEFILSQSLTFLPMNKAEKFLKIQESQVASTSNNELMLEELKSAKQKLQNGEFGMGEHEFILAIYGDNIKEVNVGVNEAVAALEAKSLGVVREKSSMLIAQYFSMLPANFRMGRLRAMPIGTDNFTSFFPMHNFMVGNVQGSQWGMPLAMMETTSASPYFLNYHVSRQNLKEQGLNLEYTEEQDDEDEIDAAATSGGVEQVKKEKKQRKESGNYQLIGPNGSGKTVVQTLIRALTRKVEMAGQKPYKSFAFDKDWGQELFINALGGRYFRFEPGEPSGINPFSLDDTPENRQFLIGLAQWCASQDPTYAPTVQDENHLQKAVDSVYELKKGRRWARIRDLLPEDGPKCLKSVLSRWVEGAVYGWVLDSKEDRFDLNSANDFGFDMTKFLAIDNARTPILMYIMHKINTSAAGSPHSIDIDEASTALKDPFLLKMIDDKARTIRKLEGVIGLGLQNAADAASGPIADTLKNQFPTRFIFPNPTADRTSYMTGLNLTEREFNLVERGMLSEPGMFLLKQGNESVVLKVDLSGMNNMLAVLSGSADNTPIAREIISRLGDDPAVWLPEFFKRRL
jgi:type IV secretion system protein VirB4